MSFPVELIEQNAWWRDEKAIEKDKHIIALSESKIHWTPRLKYRFTWDKDIVYTLRGPRQVGKTTLVKHMIRDLLRSEDPRRVFYYSCDLLDNPKGLAQTVSKFLDRRKGAKKRVYLFLDEVSSVRDWQKAVKYLSDGGKLNNATVVLTGSHTLDIRKASERLPGRRGILEGVPDKVLLPMKFTEYAETRDKRIRKEIVDSGLLSTAGRMDCLGGLMQGNIPPAIEEMSYYGKELEDLFADYILTGGVPRVVDEFLKHDRIAEGVYRTYVDVVVGDLKDWNKREGYLRQVVSRIIETHGNPVGWNTLKQGTDIASHNTIADYVETLRDNFIAMYLHFLDVSHQQPEYQREKKIHFYDPFFFYALRAWVRGGDPFQSTLEFLKDSQNVGLIVEDIVAEHMIRLAFATSSQKQLFDYESSVFYWRGKQGREVDCVLKMNGGVCLPIEVKYKSDIKREDKFGLIDFQRALPKSKTAILLTKDRLEAKGGIIQMPVWLFLLLV